MLLWIRGDRELKQFVGNRVKKIKSLSAKDSWRYCPGIQNPSDIASRGMLLSNLSKTLPWWEGPDWLRSCDAWPFMPTNLEPTPDYLFETKDTNTKVLLNAVDGQF